jgi:hypothetical protein
LRRQDEALLSMYGEFMRRGFSDRTFDEFIAKNLSANSSLPYIFYRRMLTNWMEVFGRRSIRVRAFDKDHLRGGSILKDFFAEILGEENPDISGLVPSHEQNVSLSAPAIELLRRIQPMVPFVKNGEANPQRAKLDNNLNRLPQLPRPVLSRAQSAKIMDQFGPVNEWLSDVFFPELDGPLFPHRRDLPEVGNLGELSETEEKQFMTALGL